jgi:hypothetical protein
MAQSLVAGVYDQAIDRESAHEVISARVAAVQKAPAPEAAGKQPAAADSGLGGMLGGLFGGGNGRRESAVQAMMKSAARSIGSQVGREIIRGVLGSILKR